MKKLKERAMPKASSKKKSAGKEGKPIGRITHYFSDIKVAVLKLSGPLSEGDEIRIMGGASTDFNQQVASMQMDHKVIKKAKKGSSIGLKVKEKAREGYRVFKA